MNQHSSLGTRIFHPKIISTLRTYSFSALTHDISAGIIVGIVALPLAIAFAIASGVTPDRGLITAVVAGFLISLLGGSRVQIGGPTGAFVVIVYGIIQQHGLDGLLICTIMAGFILVVMGAFRLGEVIKFIPYPLTVGFTTGIAVIIFSSQVKDLLGLATGDLPADFTKKWSIYFQSFHTVDMTTILFSLAAIIVLILWPLVSKKIPASIVVIVMSTLVVAIFKLPVETIGSRFGDLPDGFSFPAFPEVTFFKIKELVIPAFTVAMLGAIESLLSAKVADSMIEGRHRSNTELIAQGIANIVTPIFGGIPATGAIARTATNVRNGGRTPVAGIVHALTLLLLTLLLSRWVSMIPMFALAAILIVVSYYMSEWHSFRTLLRAPKEDVIVLITSFLLTVFVDLTVAIEIGLLISLVLFMKRMREVTSIKEITELLNETMTEEELRNDPNATSKKIIPKGVLVYEAEGAFFFGVAELLRDTFDVIQKPPKVLILRMRYVLAIDATGLRALKDLNGQCRHQKIQLVISGIHEQPHHAMEQSGLLREIGAENVFKVFDQALDRARALVS